MIWTKSKVISILENSRLIGKRKVHVVMVKHSQMTKFAKIETNEWDKISIIDVIPTIIPSTLLDYFPIMRKG